MSNDFYNHNDGVPATLTRGASTTIRSEFDQVQGGFDKLPAVAQMWGQSQNYGIAGGSADAWTASVASTYLTSYADGVQVRLKFPAANTTTTPTLNLNALGARPILSEAGTTIQPGDIKAGAIISLVYNQASSSFQITLGNFSSSAALSAAAALAQAGVATTQAGIATTQAGVSTAQAVIATARAGDAAASSAQAGVYAAASATGAKFFDTIALGRAGVADGATFGVKAGGSDGLTRATVYRRDSSSTQTLLYSVLSGAQFDALFPQLAPTGFVWAILDQDNIACVGVLADGTFKAASILTPEITATSVFLGASTNLLKGVAPVGYLMAWLDGDGMAAAGMKTDGTWAVTDLLAQSLNAFPAAMVTQPAKAASKAGTFLAELNHIISYGQSLSLGQDGNYIQTDSQQFDSLMFNAGMLAVYGSGSQAANHASLVPLVEAFQAWTAPGPSFSGETPMGNTAATIKRLIRDENNMAYTEQSYRLLASATGVSGASIATLSKGGTGYTNLLADIGYGLTNAATLGLAYNVPAVYWTQGEQDVFINTTQASYLAALLQLYTDLNTDIKAATGQTNDIYLICDQVSDNVNTPVRTAVALAQLQASITNPKIVLAAPTYHLPHFASAEHLTGQGYATLGAHYGMAYKRTLIDGVKFVPVSPISTVRQGKIVLIKFNVPQRPLVLDASMFSGAANSGFSMVDNVGSAMTISSVSIAGPDTVKIVTTATIPAGAKVRYGFTTYGGNLRDSQGSYVDAGIKMQLPLNNPCVTFEQTLA